MEQVAKEFKDMQRIRGPLYDLEEPYGTRKVVEPGKSQIEGEGRI